MVCRINMVGEVSEKNRALLSQKQLENPFETCHGEYRHLQVLNMTSAVAGQGDGSFIFKALEKWWKESCGGRIYLFWDFCMSFFLGGKRNCVRETRLDLVYISPNHTIIHTINDNKYIKNLPPIYI